LANLKTYADVEAFAECLGIAPGIVVGRMQHDGIVKFSQYNELRAWARYRFRAASR
jgi:HTH-type transcriptional regulator/antitoxin HigA